MAKHTTKFKWLKYLYDGVKAGEISEEEAVKELTQLIGSSLPFAFIAPGLEAAFQEEYKLFVEDTLGVYADLINLGQEVRISDIPEEVMVEFEELIG
ncbi:MAG: hypothetical protein QG583_817 [Patescibacteria group bacterium]|jgi:hypothetical protein|nr:hypothetical protein [Patescibacteria group bacterium]